MTPEGRLPVFSVDTEEDAEQLLVLACPRGADGNYYARELVQEQTLENLVAFSDKLEKYWSMWKARTKELAQKAD